jgi:hypothetical protein
MTIDYDAENWLGNPTREEMLEHFYKQYEAENELLRFEVDRYKKNQTKLIEMLSTVTIERDRLSIQLGASTKQLAILREQVDSGGWLKGLTSADRQNYQLTEQNRHLQDTVVKLTDARNQPSPF